MYLLLQYRSDPAALAGKASENGNGDDQKFRRASRQGENRLKRFRSEEGKSRGEGGARGQRIPGEGYYVLISSTPGTRWPGVKPVSRGFGTNRRNWLFAHGSLLQGDVDGRVNQVKSMKGKAFGNC